jgi:hypothetical protein
MRRREGAGFASCQSTRNESENGAALHSDPGPAMTKMYTRTTAGRDSYPLIGVTRLSG